MSKFQFVRLSETKTKFIDGDRSKKYPKREEFQSSGVIFLNAESINSGKIDLSSCNHISEKKYSEITKGRIRIYDTLLTTRGNGIGNSAFVNIEQNGLINAQMLILRPNPDEIDPRFFFYYMSSQIIRDYITNFASGSAQPQIPIRDLKYLPFIQLDLTTQKKIAAVLSAYDDLIENNTRRIALLERMAEELYKEWFVRMRFPGHESARFEKGIPEGWTIKKLPEIADITYGYPFKSKQFNNDGLGKKIIRIRNIPPSDSDDFTEEQVNNKYIVKTGDLLVGMDGEFHINHWFSDEAYLVQRVCKLKAKNTLFEGYLAESVKAPVKFFEATIMGATVAHLGAKHLNSIDILLPSETLSNYLDYLNNILSQKIFLNKQIRVLKSTRDRLLTRLISGKLLVEDLDIAFPPSMQENKQHG